MNIVTNEIAIHADAAAVWNACTQVERWPEIFDTVRSISARALPQGDVLFEMSVENALGRSVVRSQRRHDHAARRIDFVLLAAPPPIAKMDGWWTVRAEGTAAHLTIVHRLDVTDPTASATDVERRVYENTEHILQRLRAWVERGSKETLATARVS